MRDYPRRDRRLRGRLLQGIERRRAAALIMGGAETELEAVAEADRELVLA
jgi:hypothetical protein